MTAKSDNEWWNKCEKQLSWIIFHTLKRLCLVSSRCVHTFEGGDERAGEKELVVGYGMQILFVGQDKCISFQHTHTHTQWPPVGIDTHLTSSANQHTHTHTHSHTHTEWLWKSLMIEICFILSVFMFIVVSTNMYTQSSWHKHMSDSRDKSTDNHRLDRILIILDSM